MRRRLALDLAVFGVFHHADDLDIELGVGTAAEAEMLADRVVAEVEFARERLVDDADFGAPNASARVNSRPVINGMPMVLK